MLTGCNLPKLHRSTFNGRDMYHNEGLNRRPLVAFGTFSTRPRMEPPKHANSHTDDKSKQQPITGRLPVHPTDAEVVNPDQHALKVQRKRSLDKSDKNKRIADAVKTIMECLGG